ncbi:MAG: isoprenylcysteine carboxylmethyltransferase family protein [Gemmatimonadaceae bacterium]
MRPLPFVWPYWLIFWSVFFWAFVIEAAFMKRAVPDSKSSVVDKGSVWGVIVGHNIAVILGILIAFRLPELSIGNRVAMFWLGIAVLVAGSLLRRHCFRMLGQYFTYVVQVQGDQPVIERGAYRWIRHPSYTAGMLLFIGIGVSLANWLSLAILFVTTVAVYSYRVRIEERALLASMGDRYREYMSRTKRFVPFIV